MVNHVEYLFCVFIYHQYILVKLSIQIFYSFKNSFVFFIKL